MNRHCIRAVGSGIDGHLVGHHESGIEAEAEVSDDLVLVGLVLILLQEIRRTGKGHLVDVAVDLFFGHAQAVILYLDGLFVRIHRNIDPVMLLCRRLIFSDEGQLLKLRYCVAAV